MAVLFSVIIAPLLLRATLQFSKKRKTNYIEDTRKNQSNTAILSGRRSKAPVDSLTDSVDATHTALQGSDSNIFIHPVYYCIHTKTYAKWGHQHRLLKSLYSLKLELIDFRSFNETQDNYAHLFVQDVFYVKDTRLQLKPTKQLNVLNKQKLSKRVKLIRGSIKSALQNNNAKVAIMRWLPGIKQIDDMTPSHTPSKQLKIPPSYVKNEAYKQARLALSYMRLPRMRHDAHENKTDESITKNIISNPAPAYISRIHENEDTNRRRLSYVASDVLDEEHDILQQLKFADDNEVSINDDENTMSLEIIYGDNERGHRSPLEVFNSPKDTPNSVKVVKFNAPKSPNPNQNTPLLKGSLE
eukprot:773901_1